MKRPGQEALLPQLLIVLNILMIWHRLVYKFTTRLGARRCWEPGWLRMPRFPRVEWELTGEAALSLGDRHGHPRRRPVLVLGGLLPRRHLLGRVGGDAPAVVRVPSRGSLAGKEAEQ